MSDRELLELAAKAVGMRGGWKTKANMSRLACNPNAKIEGFFIENKKGGYGKLWNPIDDDDDGDALRLAVKLRMRVRTTDKVAEVDVYTDEGWSGNVQVGVMDSAWNEDAYAATRRAIVRAAAEIGRSKE